MTTTTIRAFVREPFDLALGQPHQLLISAASVAIVASEAVSIVPWPYNIALAVGAEWAYLRGLISGAGVKTRWSAALNTSAFLLVVLYGALAGFRGFHLIPETPSPFVAVLLTIIHIGAISAVTLCSAMLHRAGEDAKRVSRDLVAQQVAARELRNQEIEDARNQAKRDAEDALLIEMRRKDAELRLEKEAAHQRMQLAAERAQLRAASRHAQPRPQPRIIYGGVEYPSVQAAADAHGITRQAMSKRLRKEG